MNRQAAFWCAKHKTEGQISRKVGLQRFPVNFRDNRGLFTLSVSTVTMAARGNKSKIPDNSCFRNVRRYQDKYRTHTRFPITYRNWKGIPQTSPQAAATTIISPFPTPR